MHKRIPFIAFLLISSTGCDTPIGDLLFDQTDHNSEPIEFADSIYDTGAERDVNPTRRETEGARVFGNLPTIGAFDTTPLEIESQMWRYEYTMNLQVSDGDGWGMLLVKVSLDHPFSNGDIYRVEDGDLELTGCSGPRPYVYDYDQDWNIGRLEVVDDGEMGLKMVITGEGDEGSVVAEVPVRPEDSGDSE